MTAATPKIDAFGFTGVASKISAVDLLDTANQIWFSCRRGVALLRTLNYRLLNEDSSEANSGDVQALVELTLSALPDLEGEGFDNIEQYMRDAERTVKALQHQQHDLTALLNAMEIAASMGSTLAELDEAANMAYGIITTLPDGQRHWDAFCELIVRRGLSLELVELGAGFATHPIIHTPETLKHAKAAKRKTAELAAVLHEDAAARTTKRKAAQRRAA